MADLFNDDGREPLRRLLRERGWRQERGHSGRLLPYWLDPDTGRVYDEDQLWQRFRGEVGGG